MAEVFTTREAARLAHTNKQNAQKWAQSNGVTCAGEGKGKIYLWTADDVARFQKRPRVGRPPSAPIK